MSLLSRMARLSNPNCWLATLFFFTMVVNISSVKSESGDDDDPTPMNNGPVCGEDGITYGSTSAAREAKVKILHCAPCGACSTIHDVDIYRRTRNTLTTTATTCAQKNLLFGPLAARTCLTRRVGFTRRCEECWLVNVRCAVETCTPACLSWMLFGVGQPEGPLNPCLACDERKCGPAFKRCAGATRRRAGIISDIRRNKGEVCTHVDPYP